MQKKLTILNVGFGGLLLAMLTITISSLLGSSQVLAVQQEKAGAIVELQVEMERKSGELINSSLANSTLWVNYDKEVTLSYDGGFQLNLTLTKNDDTVFLSAQLINLDAEPQLIAEPQLLMPMGGEAAIEVGDEQNGWHYVAAFKVAEGVPPKDKQ